MLASHLTAAWSTSASLLNPAEASAIVAAAQWLEGTLLGTIATSVAVVAVASVGFSALAGRMELRRAVTIIVGCFVLFGASSIVAGLELAARAAAPSSASPYSTAADVSPLATPPGRPQGYDPYAGAAVPRR